ncbi:LacI family DNA-binding transcriptional regulator [Histidinibacterium lentulum]|uniref:LacI family transcriptional regulator n=1 Tax=Histidinibacterium lentulum TaxID=2480588 RepID=A0A3N2R506_9RHOB|nr:LacI family DNA-binding transcriptional regulator [Histidinibacterium lentulum]ROU02575.1 LacI family transcriptional regulator [Histidinibacterium lentulum]
MTEAVRRPGIRDLAAHVGLSVSTVSRALNGYADVNADTRRKVEEAAERLGYRASFAAATLRSAQTQTVTFMVSKPWTKFVDPFYLGLLDGVELVLQAQGYDLQVVMAREYEAEIDIIRRTVERHRSDALLFGRTRPEDERIDYLQARGFPFVTVGQTLRNDHDWIDRDGVGLGRQATERLIRFGHTRIAYLSPPLRYTYSHHARQGYRAALAAAGLSFDPTLEIECYLSRRTGGEALTHLITSGAEPTALFCGNDMIALSAMEAARALGLRPGHDISVIGCDDMPIAALGDPALTSFTQDLDAVGMRMARMVLAKLGGATEPLQDLVEARLIPRESDGPAP